MSDQNPCDIPLNPGWLIGVLTLDNYNPSIIPYSIYWVLVTAHVVKMLNLKNLSLTSPLIAQSYAAFLFFPGTQVAYTEITLHGYTTHEKEWQMHANAEFGLPNL